MPSSNQILPRTIIASAAGTAGSIAPAAGAAAGIAAPTAAGAGAASSIAAAAIGPALTFYFDVRALAVEHSLDLQAVRMIAVNPGCRYSQEIYTVDFLVFRFNLPMVNRLVTFKDALELPGIDKVVNTYKVNQAQLPLDQRRRRLVLPI